MTFFLVSSIVKIVVVFTVIMVGVALLTLAERRICAWIQDRLGPNRVGPQGLLQPAADGLKNLVKEETLPARADKVLFMLAPAMSFIPRSEEHTSELQSRLHLVCRLLLEKKKNTQVRGEARYPSHKERERAARTLSSTP